MKYTILQCQNCGGKHYYNEPEFEILFGEQYRINNAIDLYCCCRGDKTPHVIIGDTDTI